MMSKSQYKPGLVASMLFLAGGMALAGAERRSFDLPEPIVIEGRLFAGETLELVAVGSGRMASLQIDGEPVAVIWTDRLLRSERAVSLRLARGSDGRLRLRGFGPAASRDGPKSTAKLGVARMAQSGKLLMANLSTAERVVAGAAAYKRGR